MTSMPGLSHTTESTGRVSVVIGRTDPGSKREFSVRYRAPMTLLDVLFEIQRAQDASLAFRFFCRAGLCGTCTVRHNGAPVLACQTAVAADSRIRIDPLGGLPVIRDLVVDLEPFTTAWAEAVRQSTPTGVRRDGFGDDTRLEMHRDARECIACAACYSACPVAGSDETFAGPAALGRKSLIAIDARFADTAASEAAGASSDVAGCHSVGACSIVCPRGVDPARLIRRLRRLGREAAT